MKKIAFAAAAAMTAGAFGLAAVAQDNSSDFQRADGNKDGTISFEESLIVNSTLSQGLFDQADSNDDGVLDEAEFLSLQTLAASLGTDPSEPMSSSSAEASSSSSAEGDGEEEDDGGEEEEEPPA
jgi:hypothetical protein